MGNQSSNHDFNFSSGGLIMPPGDFRSAQEFQRQREREEQIIIQKNKFDYYYSAGLEASMPIHDHHDIPDQYQHTAQSIDALRAIQEGYQHAYSKGYKDGCEVRNIKEKK